MIGGKAKMTKLKSKRLLSLLLSLAMVFSLTVTPAFAFSGSAAVDGSEVSDGESETNEIYSTSGSVATVSSDNGTEVDYPTLAAAFEEAVSGDTITLLDDLTVTDGGYSANGLYQVSTDVTLDLDNHTLTVNTTRVFGVLNGGSLTVKNGTVKIADNATSTGNQFNILRGICSFTAEDVTFDSNNIAANFLHVAADGTATIELTDCDITHQNGGVVVYDNDGNSKVTLTGCNYETNPSGGVLNDIANFKIVFDNNNPITSESTNWEASNSLRYTYVVVDGGSVEADLTLAATKGAASLTVSGGSVIGTVKVADGTSMTVSGGTVTGTVTTYGTFTMTDGTVYGASGSSQAVLVKGGTIKISGGTINASCSRALVFDTDVTVSGTISGGTFVGDDIALLARSSENNTVSVKGGTYTATKGIDLVASILAEGYVVYDTAGNAATVSGNYYMSTLEDNTVVVSKPYVAQIDNTYYTSLYNAVKAAADGDTVTVLSDTTFSSYTIKNKSITLDLGGHTVTVSSYFTVNGGSLTVKNGTIAAGGTSPQQLFQVYGSATDTANYSVLNIESDAIISGAYWGICLYPVSSSSKLGYGAVINMEGTITSENGVGIFISGNLGNSADTANAMAASSNVSVVNVTGTINTSGPGIAMNGYAKVNVSTPASITGQQAISVKRGVLNVTGGTLTATGDYVDPATANYNGTEETGAAISVTSTYNYAGTIVVNISGGTITSENGNALYIGHSGTSDTTTAYTTGIKVSVTGGDFSTSGTDVAAVYVAEAEDGDADSYTQAIISGGTYSTAVAAEYCADGYAPTSTTTTDDEGNEVTTYSVTEFKLGVSGGISESVSASIASGYGTSTLYVKVSADNMNNYSTSAYPTTSLTYNTSDSDVDSGNYIFAGWYTLDKDGSYTACTSDMWSSTSEDAYYAKFVDANTLRVLCVYTPGSLSATGKDALRFLSGLDSPDSEGCGFVINGTEYSCTGYAEACVVSNSSMNRTFTKADFSSSANYIITYRIYEDTLSSEYEAYAYWITTDGTTVSGEKLSFVSSSLTGATVIGESASED
ncbi:MAG: hypothetical protein LIO80_05340 [Lachnospiraceae bacterium]|nr:hypothetical protein [Lachnospiraceae bacterium]